MSSAAIGTWWYPLMRLRKEKKEHLDSLLEKSIREDKSMYSSGYVW
jgi:hypothetical protein